MEKKIFYEISSNMEDFSLEYRKMDYTTKFYYHLWLVAKKYFDVFVLLTTEINDYSSYVDKWVLRLYYWDIYKGFRDVASHIIRSNDGRIYFYDKIEQKPYDLPFNIVDITVRNNKAFQLLYNIHSHIQDLETLCYIIPTQQEIPQWAKEIRNLNVYNILNLEYLENVDKTIFLQSQSTKGEVVL